MAEKLENNTQQKLLEGNARVQPGVSAQKQTFALVANAGEKRYLWTARAFAVITAISLCCNLVLFITIIQLIPLFRIEPFLLTFQNKSEQIYRIQPMKNSATSRDAISEIFVRQYVLLRNTFENNLPEMEARWGADGPLREMSSDAVFSKFQKEDAPRILELIRTRNLTRKVTIRNATRIAEDYWQVEFTMEDMYPASRAPERRSARASVRVAFRNKVVKYGDRLRNPIGFTVMQYNVELMSE